ncbi:hypothetical protein GJ744_000018 [Endocarpon pusillum]|uniref:Mid2 domain-containing protein n=1 Tax=Endocarpon pusillum TaxID=364733 RepID=A0A8H7AS81_9EURO|nr:hypothetical protein GJ744_000018 [Endocarpon pusillum]
MAPIFVLVTFLPLVIMANFNPRATVTCPGGQTICGSRCIPATSNCCSDGSQCENGGTCYTKDDGTIACCIPSHTCAAALGSSVNAPPVPICSGETPLVCHNQCIGIESTCCPQGGTCSGGGTCYTEEDGVDSCCIPGKSCVASGGLTVIVAPTGPVDPSTVTKTATATMTTVASTLAPSLGETSFSTATASSSTPAAAPSQTKTTPTTSNDSLKIGIGVGLGLGIPLIILVGVAALWYQKRRRRTLIPTSETYIVHEVQ